MAARGENRGRPWGELMAVGWGEADGRGWGEPISTSKVAIAPGEGTVLRFAGGAFLAPNDRRLSGVRGLLPSCRVRGSSAFPGFETTPAWTMPGTDELDIGGRQLDPGSPAPPPYSACIWRSGHPGPGSAA